MKFNDLLFNIISEEFANKKLLNTMLNKWYGLEPTEEQQQEGEFLITGFFKIKNRLGINIPEVRTFLNRFTDFRVDNLKDVNNYTLNQIKFIVGEFVELPSKGVTDTTPEIFKGINLRPTEERIEASKQLWYSNSDNLIVNEDGFRVYAIRNRKESQMWGYFNGFLASQEPYRSQPSHMQWCTTRWENDSNAWASYRNRRTFYFVIDESKDPSVESSIEKNQYFISALQASTDSSTSHKITTILNNGVDRDINENELYQIYPKLRGHLEKIVKVPYSQSELGVITDDLDRVDEREGNDFAFWVVSNTLKKRYIDAGKPLTKSKSWETMNDGLKKSYIENTQSNNAFERFSTMELLSTIKKSGSDTRSLEVRLGKLGFEKGVGELFIKILSSSYRVSRTSAENPNIVIFESRRDNKSGVYNLKTGDWVTLNGVTYEPFYNDIEADIHIDNDGNFYIVEVFSKSSVPTEDSFYSVYLQDKQSNPEFRASIMSASMWKQLSESGQLTPADEDKSSKPEDYSDIKEWK